MKTAYSATLALVAALGIGRAAAATRYDLEYVPDGERMHVRLCDDTAGDARRFRVDYGAGRQLENLERSDGGEFERNPRGVLARNWKAGECLTYDVALGRIADRRERDVGARAGSDLVVSPTQWLLAGDGDAPAEVTLHLPAGYTFSTPWHRLPDADGARRYRIPRTPDDWSASIAVGRFAERDVRAAGGVLHVATLGGMDSEQVEKMTRWMETVARANVTAYGRLPLDEIQVMLIRSDARRGAVGFGQSTRGQGQALAIFVDPRRPFEELRDDWTAVHELAHAAHPSLGDAGSWLAEGLASYWQNVLRARAGLITPEEAWLKLDAGFGRGRTAPEADKALHDVTADMHEHGNYMRVYWAGAAYWLAVDLELRRTSGGALSVDAAMSKFRDCCLARMLPWTPQAFTAKLDELVGTDVFGKRWREFDAQRGFPDVDASFRALGIVKENGALRYDDSAPDAAVRRAIMRPRGG